MKRASPGLLGKLPDHYRLDLQCLADDRLTPVGRPRDLQDIVDRHFTVINALLQDGLEYGDLAQLLAEVGVTRPTGAAYCRNTLSSAVHRHRRRYAAASGDQRQKTAGTRILQQAIPPVGTDQRVDSSSKGEPPTTPVLTPPAGEPQSETRRAARLINLIRDPS